MAERTIDVPEALGLSEGHDPRDIIKSLSLGFIFGQAMSALISEEYDAKKFEDLVERLVMEKVGVKIPVTEETITEDMCRAVVNIFNKLGPEIINISR